MRLTRESLRQMDRCEIDKLIDSELDEIQKAMVADHLCSLAWEYGLLLDKVSGIDPNDGPRRKHGTRNRGSYTYRIREAVRYAYP